MEIRDASLIDTTKKIDKVEESKNMMPSPLPPPHCMLEQQKTGKTTCYLHVFASIANEYGLTCLS